MEPNSLNQFLAGRLKDVSLGYPYGLILRFKQVSSRQDALFFGYRVKYKFSGVGQRFVSLERVSAELGSFKGSRISTSSIDFQRGIVVLGFDGSARLSIYPSVRVKVGDLRGEQLPSDVRGTVWELQLSAARSIIALEEERLGDVQSALEGTNSQLPKSS